MPVDRLDEIGLSLHGLPTNAVDKFDEKLKNTEEQIRNSVIECLVEVGLRSQDLTPEAYFFAEPAAYSGNSPVFGTFLYPSENPDSTTADYCLYTAKKDEPFLVLAERIRQNLVKSKIIKEKKLTLLVEPGSLEQAVGDELKGTGLSLFKIKETAVIQFGNVSSLLAQFRQNSNGPVILMLPVLAKNSKQTDSPHLPFLLKQMSRRCPLLVLIIQNDADLIRI